MTNISLSPPIVGQKNTSEEPKVGTALTTIQAYLNQTVLGTGIGTGNIIKESITEEKLSAAVQVLLNKAAAGLTLVKQAGSTTGASGNLYLMETNATTLTLPEATAGRMVGVATKNAIEESKIKCGGAAKIFGDYLTAAGVTELILTENQHMVVEADGTNWRVISGEAKRIQEYVVAAGVTKATAEAGVTPSKVRPAFVVLTTISTAGKILKAEYEVGGKLAVELAVGEIPASSTKTPCPLFVPPGQAWKLKAGNENLSTITSSTLLL